MVRRNMKSALKGSLLMEEQTVKDRFEKAESLLGGKARADVNDREVVKPKKEKVKVVRDSFTMPQADYELLKLLKNRSLKSGIETNKSEILRAGLLALNQMTERDFLNKIENVEKVKTGRPKQ